MTSLRGPDPYAIVEQEVARQVVQRHPDPATLCRVLHDALPTYTWVGLVRYDQGEETIVHQQGTPRRAATLPNGCVALLCNDLVVIHDVANARPYRTCFPEARALISVPVDTASSLVVASAHQGAFGLADRDLLERVAHHLATAKNRHP